MIEEALQTLLRPIVNRRRLLHLALRLSAYWFISGLIGIFLIAVDWLLGFRSPLANWALCISTLLMTIIALYKFHRMQPDYRAVARNIERQYPEIQALLLAAIEQEPQLSDNQLGYLQKQVIDEALRHATKHNWLESISPKRLLLAKCSGIAALVFIILALSQLLPAVPSLFPINRGVLSRRSYNVRVSPGDVSVEFGTPVVILARFEGRMPPEVRLLFGASGQESRQITLTKNLNDPVFGGIIQEVNNNLLYHVEYADQRTRDYKISVFEHPKLLRADAKIIYPSYTKLPEKVIQNTRQISAVEGSQIFLTFTLNKAVTDAQLVNKEKSVLALTVNSGDPNVYATSITAQQNQRYELHLVDAQGLTNKIPPRFSIDVHKNLPPELKTVFPNRDIIASPLEELSLEAEVSDDYGITGYGLNYTLGGSQSRDVTLSQSEISNENLHIQHLLAMEDLNAEPDQLLTYYFWANDVGSDGNIRRTSSDIYFAEVRHFEEIFRESQSFQNQSSQNQSGGQQQNQEAEQLARMQKQIISATWNIKRKADQTVSADDYEEDLYVVRQSQTEVLEKTRSTLSQAEDPSAMKTLQEASKHMETSLDHLNEAAKSASATELTPALAAEQSAYQELLKLRQREHQIAQGRSSNSSNTARSARSERQLQQLELTQRENRYETERLAQSEQQSTQREDLQVLNRLRDLARRQNETSSKLKEIEAALRQAQTDKQKQQITRELKRLREEQLEALRDLDELQQRMDRPENRRRIADTRQQLDQSRSRIRQSVEELEQGMVSRAVTSTTRAQRQLEQMRDEIRQRTSGQFNEQMRDMLDQAKQLDQRQKEIAGEIKQHMDSEHKTLTTSGTKRDLADQMDRQKESIEELMEQMKDVSDQAETSEPLLSRKLYDTLRKASSDKIDRALEVAGELLRRNFLPQAQEVEQQAEKGIEELRKGVEEAAESVLGDEAESLRLAQQQLDELIRQVNDEVALAGSTERQDGDPNGQQNSQANQRRLAGARTAAGNERPGDRTGNLRTDPSGRGGNQLGQWEEIDPNGPITGRDFRQWSDGLRDVEEMLTEDELRSEVIRVREHARAIRAEFKRHGQEPQWDLVRQQITNPLTELHKRLSDKIAELQSDNLLVPIDRDPVPGRFAELVRRYYENIGGGDQ